MNKTVDSVPIHSSTFNKRLSAATDGIECCIFQPANCYCRLPLPTATANCDRLTSQNISNKLENMKWLILLLVLFLMAVLIIVIRYRRQLKTGWQVWKMLRKMRQMGKTNVPKSEKRESLKDVPLVRCEKCGKWISPEGALKLRQEKYYCSSVCMEKAARLQSLVD